MPTPLRVVRGAIAVIERRGRLLIRRRPAGSHLAGYWEFPGGKRRPGETWEACVRREVREEVGLVVRSPARFGRLRFRYLDRRVDLAVFRCGVARGRVKARKQTGIRWVEPAELARYRFPPANRPLIERLMRGG